MNANKPIEVSLTYKGPVVRDGEMLTEDVIAALKGFSTVYSLAARKAGLENPVVNVKAIKPGSFEIVLNTLQTITQDALIPVAVPIAAVVGTIYTIIGFHKTIAGRKYTIAKDKTLIIKGDNNTVINIDNLTVQHIEMLNEPDITRGLGMIVAPLRKDKIDEVILKHKDEDNKPQSQNITWQEKDLFRPNEKKLPKTESIRLVGEIRALDKKTNNGKFVHKKRTLVMSLVMDNPEEYYQYFAYPGELEIEGTLYLDEDLDPYKIDVSKIYPIEGA